MIDVDIESLGFMLKLRLSDGDNDIVFNCAALQVVHYHA